MPPGLLGLYAGIPSFALSTHQLREVLGVTRTREGEDVKKMWTLRAVPLFLVLAVFGIWFGTLSFAQTEMQISEAAQFNPADIQRALAEAGFYMGPIDGIVGRKTRAAIRAFQEQNGLAVDGKCGPRTWEKLQPYLEGTSDADPFQAPAPQPVEEEMGLTPTRESMPEAGSDDLKQKLIS